LTTNNVHISRNQATSLARTTIAEKKKREEEEEELEEREPLKEIRWRSAGDSPERRWR
jgi:hypothetical protein